MGPGRVVREIRNKVDLYSASLYLLLLFGFYSRVQSLDQRRLWSDELFNVGVAKRGVFGIFGLPVQEEAALGPLDPMLLSLFTYFGDHAFIVRFPALLLGLVSIALIYRVGNAFFGRGVGLTAAFLLTVSLFHYQYSREARFYSLFVVTTLLSLYFLAQIAVRGKSGWKWWAAYALSAVLVSYSHLFGFFVLFSEWVFLGIVSVGVPSLGSPGRMKRRLGLPLIISIIAVFLIYLPVLPRLVAVVNSGGEFYTLNSQQSQMRPASLPAVVLKLSYNFSGGARWYLSLLMNSLFGVGLAFLVTRRPSLAFLSVWWLTAPFVVLAILQPSHFFAPRYVIFMLPLYLILVALGSGVLLSWGARAVTFAGSNRRSLSGSWEQGITVARVRATMESQHRDMNYF